MYSDEQIALCRYRLEKAGEILADAEKTLALEMYDTAANRSYSEFIALIADKLQLQLKSSEVANF